MTSPAIAARFELCDAGGTQRKRKPAPRANSPSACAVESYLDLSRVKQGTKQFARCEFPQRHGLRGLREPRVRG